MKRALTSAVALAALGLSLLFPRAAGAYQAPRQNPISVSNLTVTSSFTASSATITNLTSSTTTINGNGGKCFSVDDPTFVVDCNLNRVGVGDATPDAQLEILSAASPTGFALAVSSQSDNTGDILAVLGKGWIGVGTATPASKFHMSTGTLTVDGTAPFIRLNAGSGDAPVVITGPTTSKAYYNATNTIGDSYFGNDRSTGGGLLASSEPNATIITQAANYPINFGTNNIVRMAIAANGDIGMGASASRSTVTASGFWEPISKTKAQIDVLIPTRVGQFIYVSNHTIPGLCVSSGTSAGQWRKDYSATIGCGSGE